MDPTEQLQLRDQRSSLHDRMKTFHAEHEDKWTDEIGKEWKEMTNKYDHYDNQLKDSDTARKRLGRDNGVLTDGTNPWHFGKRDAIKSNPYASLSYRTADGQTIRALAPSQSMSEQMGFPSLEENDTLGAAIINSIRGDWQGCGPNIKALSTQTGSAGGFLVPNSLSSRIIDLARSKSVMVQAGAGTIPMETAEVRIGRITGDATASWVGESQTLTKSDPNFGAYVLRSFKLVCLSSLSVELAQDAPNMQSLVEENLAQAMSLEIDRVGLRGAGITEPQGIDVTADVNTASGAGIEIDTILTSAMLPIENANGTPNAWILHPTQNDIIRKKKTGDGAYLETHPAIVGLNRLVSTQQTDGTMTMGDFTKVLMGVRLNMQVELFRVGNDGVNNLLTDSMIAIRVLWRGDTVVMQPTHFSLLTDIT